MNGTGKGKPARMAVSGSPPMTRRIRCPARDPDQVSTRNTPRSPDARRLDDLLPIVAIGAPDLDAKVHVAIRPNGTFHHVGGGRARPRVRSTSARTFGRGRVPSKLGPEPTQERRRQSTPLYRRLTG